MFATRSIIVAAAAFAGIGTAVAAEPKPPVASAAPAPTSEPAAAYARTAEPRYCFKEAVTGSRVERKVCKTKVEWAAIGVDLASAN